MIRFYEDQSNPGQDGINLNSKESPKILTALQNDLSQIQEKQAILESKLASIEKQRFQSEGSLKHNYKLKGIIIHQGNANYGHYYSFVRVGDSWLCCDDMRVEKVDEERVFQIAQGRGEKESEGCYCLVYVKGIFYKSHLKKYINYQKSLTSFFHTS